MRTILSLAVLAAAVPTLTLAAQEGPSPEAETVLALAPAPRLPDLPVIRVVVPPPQVSHRASPEESLTRAYLASLDALFAQEPNAERARELFALRERVRAAARIVVR